MIADRIKQLRISKGMTQNDLAVLVNLTQQAIAKWEKGTSEPDTARLSTLSQHFGVSADYLLGIETAKKESPSEDELSVLLQEPLMKDIYDAVLELGPDNRALILAQIRAVRDIESGSKK